MGDRGQVLIKPDNVYLYTHSGAEELEETVRTALTRKLRWDDPEYLARIIFCEMVKDDIDGETGFGIGTSLHGDVWRLVEVDCDTQIVTVKRIPFEGKAKVEKQQPFEEFIREVK